MTPLELSMLAAGFNRSSNYPQMWYAGFSGRREPVYPLKLRVTDKIWLITSAYGDLTRTEIPVLGFNDVAALDRYLDHNGRLSEASGPGSNVWD